MAKAKTKKQLDAIVNDLLKDYRNSLTIAFEEASDKACKDIFSYSIVSNFHI